MAERSKSLDFGSEVEIAQVQILSVTLALFISTIDLVLYRLSPLFCLIRSSHRPVAHEDGQNKAYKGITSSSSTFPGVKFVTASDSRRCTKRKLIWRRFKNIEKDNRHVHLLPRRVNGRHAEVSGWPGGRGDLGWTLSLYRTPADHILDPW
ncbi:hypothetical protein J6590_073728 [Homalodisca vitripennis]|nr:hypothetical protein J6590_073728 [Homalodisca vitripennis]